MHKLIGLLITMTIVGLASSVWATPTPTSTSTPTPTPTATNTPTPTSTSTPTATSTTTPHAEATSEQAHTSIRKVVFTWTSGGAGTATVTTVNPYDGQAIGLALIPSGGGTAPSASWSTTITDSMSHDILCGAGVNAGSASATVYKGPTTAMCGAAASPLTLNVSAAGDSKAGTVVLYLR